MIARFACMQAVNENSLRPETIISLLPHAEGLFSVALCACTSFKERKDLHCDGDGALAGNTSAHAKGNLGYRHLRQGSVRWNKVELEV